MHTLDKTKENKYESDFTSSFYDFEFYSVP